MKKTVSIWAIVVITAGLSIGIGCRGTSVDTAPPRAIEGVLDLTDWDFDEDGPIDLSVKYEFRWQHHSIPTAPPGPDRSDIDGFIEVPGSWNGHEVAGKKLPGLGHATYRLTVLLKDTLPLAFKFLDMGTAYTVIANGDEILSVGKAGSIPQTTVPRYFPQVVEFVPGLNRIDLVYQVSNFHHRSGGTWEVVRLGTREQIHRIRDNRLAGDLILFGSILIMGLYHIGLFAFRRKDASLIYFALF